MTDASAAASRDFLDTNILVYLYDRRDLAKQSRAFDVTSQAIASGSGVISAQVLGEFFNTVTRRIPNPIGVEVAEDAISLFATMPVVEVDLALVRRAVTTCARYQISYWDALIIAAAERSGCDRIISEDLNPGQLYHGIAVVSPFDE